MVYGRAPLPPPTTDYRISEKSENFYGLWSGSPPPSDHRLDYRISETYQNFYGLWSGPPPSPTIEYRLRISMVYGRAALLPPTIDYIYIEYRISVQEFLWSMVGPRSLLRP